MMDMQRRKQKRDLPGRRGRVLSLILILILVVINLPLTDSYAMSTAKLETVYIDGVNGKDTNSGKSKELAVSTFGKAKELLDRNGTIVVTSNVYIGSEEKWSLPSETYGSAVVTLGGSNAGASNISANVTIQVNSTGTLILENITIIGAADTLIQNSGTVKVNENTVIKKNTTILNTEAIQTLAGGIIVQSGTEKEIATETSAESTPIEEAEDKRENTLEIEQGDLLYGEEAAPTVMQNQSKGEISFLYKMQGASDSTYSSEEPKKIGTYTVKAVSAETQEYKSGSAIVDFEIKKAKPDKIIFPTAGTGVENSVLATVKLTGGSGAGTFTWLDGTKRLQTNQADYIAIFTPEDTYNYDYTDIEGYDSASETVRCAIVVTVVSSLTEGDVFIAQTDEAASITSGEAKENEAETTAKTNVNIAKETEMENSDTDIITAETNAKSTESQKTEAPANARIAEALLAIQSLPGEITSMDGVSAVILATNIYEALSTEEKEEISEDIALLLQEAQIKAGIYNHESNQVTVTGGDIPWYVQLRVLVKSKSEYAEATDLETVILPYEIKLWNLMTQSEYKLEAGKEAIITIPLSEVEGYTDIKVVHYKKDGTFEYIIPNFNGKTMSFATTSFSPFDIGGSEELIGKNTSGGETEKTSEKETQAPKETEKSTTGSTSSSSSTESSSSSGNAGSNKTNNNIKVPTTGDYAPIILMVVLVVVSAIVIGVLLLKKKKDNDEDSSF